MSFRHLDLPQIIDALARTRDTTGLNDVVFDADGTLWRSDIGDEAFAALAHHNLVKPHTVTQYLAPWAQARGVALPSDGRAAVLALIDAHERGALMLPTDDGDSYRHALYAMQAGAFAGLTHDAIAALSRELCRTGFLRGVYRDMAELVAALTQQHFAVWVASASHRALVAPAVAGLGIAAQHVIGMDNDVMSDGSLSFNLRCNTYGVHKCFAVRRALKRRPLAAFGDSVLYTDRQLLNDAVVAVATATRGRQRAAAIAHPTAVLFDPR